MAEVSAFQELQLADANGDGATSDEELQAYLARVAPQLAEGLLLTVDGVHVPLRVVGKNVSLPQGAGGLKTLRIECDFEGEPARGSAPAARRLRFEDGNHTGRVGWREIVVRPAPGTSVFDSTAYGSAVTDEIRAYPADVLAAPLDERAAELSFTEGAAPAGARVLLDREGRPAARERDLLAELIKAQEITPWAALLGLLVAAALGAMHAMSPGHGKTVVGAYLVGTRGTARHAAFLGLTVTVTHTAGVFALGLVTLFASQYVLPERLFPVLSFVSGAIVVAIGLSLFARRLGAAFGGSHAHEHHHGYDVDGHAHDHGDGHLHTHGGRAHTHLPPGADGGRVTWRSLLALGISGGLLPCPSALVVLLSAIALHRVAYGLLLVFAFSLGLAATLTAVGLAFVFAGRLMKGRVAASGRLVRVLPALSALVITCVGAAICYEALKQSGFDFARVGDGGAAGAASTASVLALGLVFGLKHALEADHLAAVCAIVSERKSVLSSSLVGGLWGVGHTVSLLAAGVLVILLRVEIGKRTEMALEFCVALMLVALGANAVRRLRRGTLHWHAHSHGPRSHAHPHLHEGAPESGPHTHHGFRMGARPLVVGMIHGLAGSAALMLLVLSTIKSPLAGLAYILVFGVGSVGGMMAMSLLVGLPFHFTGLRFARANLALRGLAGLFSLCFGLFMVYEIGFVDGLLL
ncbi:MAG: sulfite exporter TauE/SafE family protein [Acidobacteria bacterium]|nr:sulfite exporter TauE/SafE family protein [Acidobacteriota bacterium]